MPARKCDVCGLQFEARTVGKRCSPACRKIFVAAYNHDYVRRHSEQRSTMAKLRLCDFEYRKARLATTRRSYRRNRDYYLAQSAQYNKEHPGLHARYMLRSRLKAAKLRNNILINKLTQEMENHAN